MTSQQEKLPPLKSPTKKSPSLDKSPPDTEKSPLKKIPAGTHKAVLKNSAFKVEDTIILEQMEVFNTFDDNETLVSTVLSNYNAIGDRNYTSAKLIVKGEVIKDSINTNLSDEQLEDFKSEWTFLQKWKMFRHSLINHLFSK